MTDTDLWNSFRKGDRTAFRQIYNLYARDLFNYAFKITVDRETIEDVIHDLFLDLWNSKKLSETNCIKFYLFAALRKKLATVKKTSAHRFEKELTTDALEDTELSIENILIDQEGREQLLAQLQRGYKLLTQRQQQALNLRFYMHFSNEEIAQIMGVNYQSACKFIYTGLKALRETVRILTLIFGVILWKYMSSFTDVWLHYITT